MKRHPFIIFLTIAVVLAFIAAVSLALRQGRDDSTKLSIMIESLLTRAVGPELDTPQAEVVPQEDAPFLRREADGTTVRGNSFTLDVPLTWAVGDVAVDQREADGRMEYGYIANRQPQAMDSGDDLVMISIYDVLKDDATSYDDVVAQHAWDAEDVQNIVSFMQSEAADIYPDFSEADVAVALEDETIGDTPVKKATLSCLKPCYIEGGASNSSYYFVDALDRVYLIYVYAPQSEQTDELLSQADAVIKTFRVE